MSNKQLALIFLVLLATSAPAAAFNWLAIIQTINPWQIIFATLASYLGASVVTLPTVHAVPRDGSAMVQYGVGPATASSSATFHQCFAAYQSGLTDITLACKSAGVVLAIFVTVCVVLGIAQSCGENYQGAGASQPGEARNAVAIQEIRIEMREMRTENTAIHSEIRNGFRQLQPLLEHPGG